MDISLVILEQLVQMFLIMMFGFTLVKAGVLDMHGSQQVANVVTKFIIPIVLMMSFQQEFDSNRLISLGFAFLGSVVVSISRIFVAHFTLKNYTKIDRYGVVFSNTAFMGIPIILPLLGYEGIFYLSTYIVISSILQFTYGIWSLSDGKESVTIKRALTNPGTLGAFAGIVLYLARIQLPPLVYDSFDTIASLSSPLGMILLGGYLARSQLKEIFFVRKNYWTVANRLIISPIVGILLLWLLPITNEQVLLTLVIANCTPIAVNTALFSQLYGGDYEYGARLIVLASLLSMGTMPIMITLSNIILGIS